jgi:ATP-dependent Clp protease ATP-binding subunit ClpA
MKIAFGDVPATLRNRRVFRLSLDALAKGARTSDEFAGRVAAVFAEAEQAESRIVLFVDQLHQYAGARARLVASAAVKAAIETSHLQIIGGANPEAYSQYIASDESLTKLFEPISIDQLSTGNQIATIDQDQRQSPINEEFEGEKISSDMRELMNSAGPNGRVTAIQCLAQTLRRVGQREHGAAWGNQS